MPKFLLDREISKKDSNLNKESVSMNVDVSYWVVIILRRVLTLSFLRKGYFFEKFM